MTKPTWIAHLGAGWKRFSAERSDMDLIGTVQHGPQIGALGRLTDGGFVQVNGDVLSHVNSYKVTAAVNLAVEVGARQIARQPARRPVQGHKLDAASPQTAAAAPPTPTSPSSPPTSAAPRVTITYRKRRAVAPDAA